VIHVFGCSLRIWQDFFPGSLAGFWVRIRFFFQNPARKNESCRSGVRSPGRKKFLSGYFGHPGRNFLLGCREKRSCQIVKERPYIPLSQLSNNLAKSIFLPSLFSLPSYTHTNALTLTLANTHIHTQMACF
jgi:hypothetical protein